MNNKQDLKELYKIFLINLVEKNKTIDQTKIKKCIETYLDKSIINKYESTYSTFSYIYDIEKKYL